MFHCFTENIGEKSVTITGPDVNHIRSVLRMHEGDDIYVSDGHGRNVLATISSISADVITADIIRENAADTELPIGIVLYQGLPKADKMELIIQKAVELGAVRIVPVRMSRCVVKLDDKAAAKKTERWQKNRRIRCQAISKRHYSGDITGYELPGCPYGRSEARYSRSPV